MSRWFGIAFATIVLLGSSLALASEPSGGGRVWRAARWGMSVDEVLAAFPGEALQQPPKTGFEGVLIRATIRSCRIGSVDYEVLFAFDREGKLRLINLEPRGKQDYSKSTIRDLELLLIEKYGPPESSDDVVSLWRNGDTLIRLSHMTIGGQIVGVFLQYKQTGSRKDSEMI